MKTVVTLWCAVPNKTILETERTVLFGNTPGKVKEHSQRTGQESSVLCQCRIAARIFDLREPGQRFIYKHLQKKWNAVIQPKWQLPDIEDPNFLKQSGVPGIDKAAIFRAMLTKFKAPFDAALVDAPQFGMMLAVFNPAETCELIKS